MSHYFVLNKVLTKLNTSIDRVDMTIKVDNPSPIVRGYDE